MSPEAGAELQGRWKIREPRDRLLHFDRRCFKAEELLLGELQSRMDVIPEVARLGGVELQRFVEGATLGELHPSGGAVPDEVLGQILDVFRALAGITSGQVHVERKCEHKDRAMEGDSAGFLERLVCFTEEKVYEANSGDYGRLFADLRIEPDCFQYLRKHVAGLRERPFCLLHADLHRENLIIDEKRKLWVIDWELAMFGDPLYDLATHLYLMRYPENQERSLIERWRGTVDAVREGSSEGWREDLPKLLAYKRAQSLFTDVIRGTQSLPAGGRLDRRRLRAVTWKVWDVLRAAAGPLGLADPPGPLEIEAAVLRWWRRTRTDPVGAGGATGPG
ncbi:phosphotransferase [Streptomyces fructofermentans]|uniref:phosphotransferase n=1 Tax=Streptomyces fructofermentans TaxID=152141 RepID=UPI0037A1EAEF